MTIDRPENLNALTVPVLSGLADLLESAAGDPGVKVVRLGGAGRAFCAGASMNVDDWHGVGSAIEIARQGNRGGARNYRDAATGRGRRARPGGR